MPNSNPAQPAKQGTSTATSALSISAVDSLTILAHRINAEHAQAEAALNNGLRHALEAGRLLLEAKHLCAHGTWARWLKDNFRGSARTARAYALAVKRLPALQSKRQHAANLSLREAFRLSAPSKGAGQPEQPRSEDTHAPQNLHREVDEVFLATIPELSTDQELYAISADDRSYYCEVYPSIKHPGFFHLVIHEDLDTDNASVVYDRRGVRYDRHLLAWVLDHMHGYKPMLWGTRPASEEEFWGLTAGGIPAPGRARGQKQ